MAHSDESLARSGEQKERITIAFLALAWIFLLLRIWTRTFIISNFGWDDSIMILATMIFTVYCGACFYIDANGGGTHISNLIHLRLLTKWVVVSEATYVVAMMMLKISLGIFFTRIVVKTWQIGLIYVNVGVNIISSVATFFYVLFRCGSNLDIYADQQFINQCTSRTLDRFMAYQQASITTLTDLVFVVLPIFVLWNANMSRRSKISVGLILSLATAGVICSLLRFRYVEGLTDTANFFWASVNIAIWSTIECGTSIVAGCLATLRPLLKRFVITARSSTALGSSYIKRASRSVRSNERSTTSTIPHYNSASKEAKVRESTILPSNGDTLLEFLARPNEEVIMLNDRGEHSRESTDRIWRQPSVSSVASPPSALTNEKRQTRHTSWSFRNVGSHDRGTSERSFFND
ncbi:hypothetical protein HBI56_158540 [Parastagonospora nodorum]|uniref:Rhodopsin domain-containing protein n=1 Tax=Phaeosphaeria nodorum (strain SN15 / ATCC MYA-4574 / FGSC 10173) TaxID=321614 RepID=A0A7U2EWM4_PHANO|nr:hypothetical protein HBH56_189260 [Parastagonospora nodorum]QRC92314.1 hypothetical protein JI435_024480 [Parastagonospora nodorum SN15]KAH3925160.1 hypothetical protein HBH54_185070 [Parastagonospora nodorum]KAH3954189.1 hypothetical protein HBH53_024420 [Parastagonospora nodorum]KAH3963672.1 hypothetical protein HBH51_164260 [Parastagonospora nodorum]